MYRQRPQIQRPQIRRQRMQPRGFGDTVANAINKYTNVKPQEDCGCKKRQEKLNKMFPYQKRT